MNKTLKYSGFAIFSLLVILGFVTAKSYTQLLVAIIFYPVLAFFAFKLFSSKTQYVTATPSVQVPQISLEKIESLQQNKGKVEVVDVDKRMFLKLVGAAGVSFFLFSLLGRRVETLFFGKALETGLNKNIFTSTPSVEEQTEIQLTQGYSISEIDDGIISYYGFINKNGDWLIMKEDAETGSFRYAKGASDFSKNWNSRKTLKYDYYHHLF